MAPPIVRVKVVNAGKIKRAFKALPEEQTRVLRNELARGARQILAVQKRRAPKDTGELQRNLTARKLNKGFNYNIGVNKPRGGKIDPDVFWAARAAEFGTAGGKVIRARDARVLSNNAQVFGTRVTTRARSPRPFIRPSIKIAAPKFLPRLERAFFRTLDKVGRIR